MSDAPNHRLTLFFTPEFADSIWAGIDYELAAPLQPRGEWIIGRSRTAQITVDIRTISIKHAVIAYSFANDCWLISDLGSHNGTRLNGVLLTPPRRPFPLAIGDRIDLGPSARIHVVENSQDTISDEAERGPPTIASTTPILPAVEEKEDDPPAPRTYADSAYVMVQWIISGQTPGGKFYRLLVGAAGVAFFIFLVDWFAS